MKKWIDKIVENKKAILDEIEASDFFDKLQVVGDVMVHALKNKKKIILAGNGGSAADAQHFAGEMLGRFLCEDRDSLPALSLCVDASVTTCIANDYGYDKVFARQVEGWGQEGDIFVAISTSGNSNNLLEAIRVAKNKNMITVGLLGKTGGDMKEECDYSLIVPSDVTPRIQEIHTFVVHLLCEYIERKMFL